MMQQWHWACSVGCIATADCAMMVVLVFLCLPKKATETLVYLAVTIWSLNVGWGCVQLLRSSDSTWSQRADIVKMGPRLQPAWRAMYWLVLRTLWYANHGYCLYRTTVKNLHAFVLDSRLSSQRMMPGLVSRLLNTEIVQFWRLKLG